MIGLPLTYRFTIFNASGVTLNATDVKVYGRRKKIAAADGQLVFEAGEALVFAPPAAVAHNAYSVGGTISNAFDKYLSADFVFEVITTGSPAGDVFLFFERATDGGTAHWPDAGNGALMCKLSFSAAGTKRIDFSL